MLTARNLHHSFLGDRNPEATAEQRVEAMFASMERGMLVGCEAILDPEHVECGELSMLSAMIFPLDRVLHACDGDVEKMRTLLQWQASYRGWTVDEDDLQLTLFRTYLLNTELFAVFWDKRNMRCEWKHVWGPDSRLSSDEYVYHHIEELGMSLRSGFDPAHWSHLDVSRWWKAVSRMCFWNRMRRFSLAVECTARTIKTSIREHPITMVLDASDQYSQWVVKYAWESDKSDLNITWNPAEHCSNPSCQRNHERSTCILSVCPVDATPTFTIAPVVYCPNNKS